MDILSTDVYNKRKQEALNTNVIRKEISLSEFNVIDNKTININGIHVNLSDKAFGKILNRMRIPKAFAKRFTESFGDDGLKQLINMLKSSKVSKNDHNVTLIVNPDKQVIIDILPAGYASVSSESFIDFAERYINGYNLEPTHFGSDLTEGTVINTLTPNKIFQVPGLDDEVFKTGVTFKNTPSRGVEVTPYLIRLICSNGWTTSAMSETFSLNSFTEKNINEFNEHMIQMASSGFQPTGVIGQIHKANSTNASLAELQHAASKILSVDSTIDYDYIQRYAPIEKAKQIYKNSGVDISNLTKEQMKHADSGLSVYDIFNGLSNFASNDTKNNINDSQRSNLMIKAGDLLWKKKYDMESLIDINPFKKDELLSSNELINLRGDN